MKKKGAETEQLRVKLRQRGFKVTRQRIRLLEVLSKAEGPLSPFEIYERTKGDMDRSSVYRVIEILVAADLVRRIDFRHNHPHYELNTNDDHHHIICLSCGYSEEISCKIGGIEKVLLKNSKTFSEIKDHSLEFYGYCYKCL